MIASRGLPLACLACGSLFSSLARADAFDAAGGAVALGRAGAWLARADDPVAAFYNPAAMVRNPSGAHLGAGIAFRSHCFSRLGPGGAPVSPGGVLNPPPGPACADAPPFPNPEVGAAFRIGRRWAVGIALVSPAAIGPATWPDVIRYPNRVGVLDAANPAPQRYLSLGDQTLLLDPTASVAFAILPNLSIGAGFVAGIARWSTSMMVAAGSTTADDYSGDIRTQLTSATAFVPGFIASALWSPTRRLDLAAYYRYSADIRADVDLAAQSNDYAPNGGVNQAALADPANTTSIQKAGRLDLPVPMEARIGLGYHHPRSRFSRYDRQAWLARYGGAARDGMSRDLFDVEIDLGWSHDSAVQQVELAMIDGLRFNGAPAAVPPSANLPRNWLDVVSMRAGGEWVAIPDLLALRVGGFFASRGAPDGYLSLEAQQGVQGGPSCGATLRLGRVDGSLGYQHVFFGALDNGGYGQVHGLSGDASAGYRTGQIVNGGRATAHMDVIALGVTAHW